MKMKKISLSIIVPVYNSLEILPSLVNEIEKNRIICQLGLKSKFRLMCEG